MVRHPGTGKYRRTRLFVLTLGYSRKSVRLLTFASSTRRWAELHEEAFRRLGGSVRVIVLDNLREGVLTPDIYDPTLNPLYRDVLAHYGVVALPCRVGAIPIARARSSRPSAMPRPRRSRACASRRWPTAQAYLDRWEARWADTRIHGTTKRQVAAMFAEERPRAAPAARRAVSLLPLRHPHRASRRLRRGRPRLLRPAARLDRAGRRRAVGRAPRPPARSHHRPATARASTPGARPTCDPPGGPADAHAADHAHPAGPGRPRRGRTSAPCARPSTAATASAGCAGSSASSPSPRNMGPPPSTPPAPPPWSSASPTTASSAATSSATPRRPLTLRQVDPLIRELTHYRDIIARKTQEAPA